MQLAHLSWQEVEAHWRKSPTVILPVGSIEQHGPMGLIGTDAICAEEIAWRAAEQAGAIVAPTLSYTPAPFNMGFAGTLSLSDETFEQMVREILRGLSSHGVRYIYVLNGHGANLAPLSKVAGTIENASVRVRSWWDFEPVNVLRRKWYGDQEGMHATPSEISITQATHRVLPPGDAAAPPRQLSAEYIKAHAGDKHGPPDAHRKGFPDGRVGSHSALATPAHGRELLETAAAAVADDFTKWCGD